jgi:alpha-1,3-rhamnosyl/mannosyltransferase
VLRALAEGQSADTRLKVVGPTPAGPRFEPRSELQSLLPPAHRDRVDWLGDVSAAELDRLYAEAIALIYPSLAEGFGHPPLEVMAHGTPVIAAPVPSIPEGFGGAALLIDPLDPSQLREAMERVRSDNELRRRLIERGLELVRRYDWRETAERTLAVYRELVGQLE